MDKTSNELLRMKERNQIDSTMRAEDIGRIIDLHNSNVDLAKEKQFAKEMNDRNLYYYKLWQRAIEAIRRGERPKEKSKPHHTLIHKPPNLKSNSLFLPNGEKYKGKESLNLV